MQRSVELHQAVREALTSTAKPSVEGVAYLRELQAQGRELAAHIAAINEGTGN